VGWIRGSREVERMLRMGMDGLEGWRDVMEG
jgi:hypothetical protein